MPRVIDVELQGREDESSCSSILSSWLATAQSRIATKSDTSRQREDFAESRRRRREQRSIIRQELSSSTMVQEKQPLESIIPGKTSKSSQPKTECPPPPKKMPPTTSWRQLEDLARRRRRQERITNKRKERLLPPSKISSTVVQEKQPVMNEQQDAIQTCNEDIEQTRAMISKIIAKPKCSEKLLNKPPFRFIHDLVMGIGKAIEFDLGMIFSDEELIASNVKDKQPKLQFLEKLIIFIEGHLATSIDVKPSKIVSGLEPERTRYLLQLFTVVVTTKSDTIVDERPSKPSTADPAPSKSIKERAESLEGHLISKFDVSEANRNSVPAWKQNRQSRDVELAEARKILSENRSSCEKYIRSIEVGVPIDAVAYRMRGDGVDADVIEAFTKLYKQSHNSAFDTSALPSNSLVSGTLETSKSSSDASELDKLFDIGDWKSILSATKEMSESDSEQLHKLIKAGDWKGILAATKKMAEREEADSLWQEIAHQSRQDGVNEEQQVANDSSSQQSPVLLGEEIISISSSSETDAHINSPISLLSSGSKGDASADLVVEIRREVEAKNWYRVGELAAILLCKDRPAVPTLRPDTSLCESDVNDLIGKGDWDRVMLIAANLVFRRESFFPSDEDVCCQLIGKWMNDADDTLEEREVQAYLETVLLPIVTRSRSNDQSPVTPPRLTVLHDLKQSRDQLQVLDLLSELSIPYTIVDGMDVSQKEKRDAFFETSGIRGNYPQIFTSASSDACFYLGGLEWLRNAHKTGELNFLR